MKPIEPYEIDTLLMQYSFDELGTAEKTFVLLHIADRSEYEMLRSIVIESSHTEEVHAPVILKNNLMAAFEQKHASKGGALFPLFKTRPYLLAAASIAVLVGIWWAYPFGQNEKPLLAERKAAPSQNIQDSTVTQQATAAAPFESNSELTTELAKEAPIPAQESIETENENPILIADLKKEEKIGNAFSSSMDDSSAEIQGASSANSQITQGNDQEDLDKTQGSQEAVVMMNETASKRSADRKEKNAAMTPAAMSDSPAVGSLSLEQNETWLEGHYTAY